MYVALTYVAVSFISLILLTFVYVIEDARGKRVFLVGFRERLDVWIEAGVARFRTWVVIFFNGFMRLLFHYGAHTILKRVLSGIRSLEVRVEELVRKNKKIARDLRNRTKNHLDEIREHKEENALSEKEKAALLSHEK